LRPGGRKDRRWAVRRLSWWGAFALVATGVAAAGTAVPGAFARGSGAISRAAESAGARPDIVLIVVDALRADRLGLYGYARPSTPWLVAHRGHLRWFTDVVTGSTHTVPSVASLFTGVEPREHRLQYDTVGTYFPPYGEKPRLDTAIPTLAEVLKEAGYDTRAVVGNPWLMESTGFGRGFARFDDWKVWDRKGLHDDTAMMQAAADTLVASAGRPRFVWAHLMTVHNPYDKGHRTFVRHAGTDRYVNGPATASPADRLFMSDLYDSDVAYVDTLVGSLLDRLSARQGDRQVVVAIVGDHGEEFLEHGGFGHGTTLFQELARVPVIVWGPGVVSRRGASAIPLQLSEVRAMLLALAGVGKDPLAGLLSTAVPEPRRDGSRLRSIELYNEKAVYQAPWKYIVTKVPWRERLFNLAQDPAESVDRSADAPAVLARLRGTAHRLWPDIVYPAAPAEPVGRARQNPSLRQR
jgi:arylsulfatase A-like enzyme